MKNHRRLNYLMEEAGRIASENVDLSIGGPFGALIVLKNKIIGTGTNRVTIDNDPTAHAEIVAIRDACSNQGTFNLSGAELFSSCEPCPMCLSAIYWSRIEKVYYGNSRWDASKIGFDDADLYAEFDKRSSERRVKMIHVSNEVVKESFKKWLEKEDKIPY